MPTHLLCASCLICLFIHFLRLLCALFLLPGAFQVLNATHFWLGFVLRRGCYLFLSHRVVANGLSQAVGMFLKCLEVQHAGLWGCELCSRAGTKSCAGCLGTEEAAVSCSQPPGGCLATYQSS